ncbi:MAG: hypothetical protein KDC87_19115 [Planctomycetes bacterium]|nr:hypothetical protein [Planctomycetota bacterium]MCB9870368.1 hypothetical protein [Planctomycetota bacterium]
MKTAPAGFVRSEGSKMQSTAPLHTPGFEPNRHESGVAIVMAMFFVIITAGLVVAGSIMMKSSNDKSEVQFRRTGQASQFARSGLTEALSWLRHQNSQPVLTFAPRKDLSVVPPITETDDPDVGLVREFEISKDTWGRYEVWKQWDTDPITTRLAFRRMHQAMDMSSLRGLSSAGNIWLLRSVGYVYQRRDATKKFDEKPNRVLSSVVLEAEVQRLALQPPGQAALCAENGSGVVVQNSGRIRGGTIGAGVFYKRSTGDPSGGSKIAGNPALSAVSDYYASVKSVFGVSARELRAMSQLVVTRDVDFPGTIPEKALVYADVGSITFNSSRSLQGTGVVYIKGNVTMSSGNKTSFNGLLYVEGNLSIREAADMYGAVICTGTVTVNGNGDWASIWYDDDVLNKLRTEVGQYRWASAVREGRRRE